MAEHTIDGITIDAAAIAQGLYDLFDSNEQACVAFGMLPAEKMRVLEKQLGQKVEDMARAECLKKYGFVPDVDCGQKEIKERFVHEALYLVSAEIYSCAKRRGKMVV